MAADIRELKRKRLRQRRRILFLKRTGLSVLFVVLFALCCRYAMRFEDNLGSDEAVTALEDGGIPKSLAELYVRNEEAREFVLDYGKYAGEAQPIDVSGEWEDGGIPLFLQWDRRWGYEKYGDDFMAVTGCGPTCLAMVYCGLTGKTDYHPLAVARLAEEEGYYVAGSGSSWSMMTDLAKELGLAAEELRYDRKTILSRLRDGSPIICIMRAGDFTTGGHFIVLTGLTDEDKVLVNDPNSPANSAKAWDVDVLMKQMKNLWGYRYL